MKNRAGVLAAVVWTLLQPQVDALLTAYGRNPDAAEAAAQVFINENIPDLAYAARTVTFSSVEGIPVYVVDFFDNNAPIPYGVRMLVDRKTLKVRLYQTANMTEAQPITTSPSDSSAQTSGSQLQLPAVASLLLANSQIIESTDFTTFSADGWSGSDSVVLDSGQSGLLELPGDPSSIAYVVSPQLAEGRGVVIRFELTNPLNSVEMFLASGDWNTPTYLLLGVALYETGNFEPLVWKGTESRPDLINNSSLDGALAVTTDHWYGLFLGSDTSGQLRAYVWDWENPTQYVWTSLHQGIAWGNQTWNFVIQGAKGTVSLDDYGVVAFDGLK